MDSPETPAEQAIELPLDLGIRNLGARRDEVGDQPGKRPVGQQAPARAELFEDAIDALGIGRLTRRVGPWQESGHEGGFSRSTASWKQPLPGRPSRTTCLE